MDELLEHLDSLYILALRLTKDKTQAYDLTQQTCLVAIKNAAQLRDKKSLKAWLFKILRNLIYESWRRKENEPQMVSIDQRGSETLLFDSVLKSSTSGPASHRPLSEEVEQALASLPGEMKMVLLLADVEEFRYQEIAEIMSCPVGTVRSRLARARERLANKLTIYAQEEGIIKKRKY
jgi:RNA polymerase sigma-70 factor (ECF subfamily)